MRHSTPIFAIGPAAYASLQVRRYLGRAAAVLAVPVLACLGFAFAASDWRWAVVAFAVILVAVPAVSLPAWLALMANPQAALRCRPQQWNFAENGDADITYFVPATGSDDEAPLCGGNATLRLDEVKGFEQRAKNAIFYMAEPRHAAPDQIFILPASFLPVGLADKIHTQLDE